MGHEVIDLSKVAPILVQLFSLKQKGGGDGTSQNQSQSQSQASAGFNRTAGGARGQELQAGRVSRRPTLLGN